MNFWSQPIFLNVDFPTIVCPYFLFVVVNLVASTGAFLCQVGRLILLFRR